MLADPGRLLHDVTSTPIARLSSIGGYLVLLKDRR